jgi:UDP-glucose 4-epimerase
VRVLVTGSSGLVGRPVCEEFRAQGDSVDEYDIRPPPGEHAGSFEPRDIRDLPTLRAAAARVDGVVHLAAISRCASAEADPPMARLINVEGTRNVLDALASTGRPAWFVFASSREVYGEVSTVPVSESFPVRPKAVYGQTKADAEAEVRRAHRDEGRPAAILRLTNLYGSPWDHAERVIPSFLTRARLGEPLEVRGPGQVLDFLHVRDAVRAIVRSATLLRHPSADVEAINVASGEGITLLQLADRVVAITGSVSPVVPVAPAAWTPSKFVADISRARSVLDWEPRISLSQGLTNLLAAYDTLRSPA